MKKPLFLTSERIKFIKRRIILPIILVHIVLSVAATFRNNYIKSNKYAAVLISDRAISRYDYWASPLAFIGAYPYWTYYFNNRGYKTEWFLRAKSTDLNNIIQDERFESLVLVGHGSFNSWQAVDKLVTNEDVKIMMVGKKRKIGEWIQLTCAVEDTSPIKIGQLVMEKPDKVYTYDNSVNTFIFVTDALFGFKYLKSISNSRKVENNYGTNNVTK